MKRVEGYEPTGEAPNLELSDEVFRDSALGSTETYEPPPADEPADTPADEPVAPPAEEPAEAER
jgi:hypothetical protein